MADGAIVRQFRLAMRRLRPLICLLIVGLLPALSSAHEMRPGYLEIRETASDTYDVMWKVPALGESMRLGLYLRFAEDVETVAEPVVGFFGNAHVQRMRIRRIGGLTGSTVTIDGLDATFTDVLLRLELADGTEITHRLTPAHYGFGGGESLSLRHKYFWRRGLGR